MVIKMQFDLARSKLYAVLTNQSCTTRVSDINIYFVLCSLAQQNYFAATPVFLSLVELLVILVKNIKLLTRCYSLMTKNKEKRNKYNCSNV